MKSTFLRSLTCIVLFFMFSNAMLQAQTFEWARQYGTAGGEIATGLAVDAAGNVYITGTSDSSYYDFFISKLDSNGNFIWTKLIGGPWVDVSQNLSIDNACNLYISGTFSDSVDFNPGTGINQLTSNGLWDAFLLKLDSAGNFIWVKQLGGLRDDGGRATCIDNSNNIYFVGTFWDTVYVNTTAGLSQIITHGLEDAFITKLDSSGNILWIGTIGGTEPDGIYSIAFDNNGDILALGRFNDVCDFNPDTTVANNLQSFGKTDIFVCKWDTTGEFIWVKQLGGTNDDAGLKILTDALNDIYITGRFIDTIDVDPGAFIYNLISNGNYDIFINKLDMNGNFLWAKSWGGTGIDLGFSLDIDSIGNIYTTGKFADTVDFDPNAGVYNLVCNNGSGDTFISKLDPFGNLIWAKQLAGNNDNGGWLIWVDNKQNIYVSGLFAGALDFNPSASVYNLTSFGIYDAFVVKLSQTTTGLTFLSKQNIFLNVFPNPFINKLNVLLNEQASIVIYDVVGKSIFTSNLDAGITTIDLTGKENGVYTVNIQTSAGSANKIIIKN